MRGFRYAFGLALAVGAGLATSVALGSTSMQSATTSTTPTTAATTTTSVAVPSNTTRPTITGTARDGSAVSATNGSWTGSPTSYAYHWLRCDSSGGACAAIAGATSKDYTVTTADVDHRLRVDVTASNASGSGTASSDPSSVVQPSGSAPANTRAKTMTQRIGRQSRVWRITQERRA